MPNIYVHKKFLIYHMRFLRYIQQQVRNFFGISSTEVNAFIILLPLMIILLILFPFYHYLFPGPQTDISADSEQLQNLVAELAESNKKIPDESHKEIRYISSFDPNTASFEDLLTVGMDTIVAARLIKYRNSGGIFKYKEDIRKIYGVDEKLYSSLEETNSLPKKQVPVKSYEPEFVSKKLPAAKSEKEREAKEILFNINKADTITLAEIRGIGLILSARIIKYRDLLGGFIDTTQYKEVYGLKPEVLEQLYKSAVIEENFLPRQIKVNTSNASQLAQHPYISWTIAKAIVSYRNQHGDFTSLDQISAIKVIDESALARIKSYLSL